MQERHMKESCCGGQPRDTYPPRAVVRWGRLVFQPCQQARERSRFLCVRKNFADERQEHADLILTIIWCAARTNRVRFSICPKMVEGYNGAARRASRPRPDSTAVLPIEYGLQRSQCVDVGGQLVAPPAHDARKAQGEAALVTVRFHNVIESDFQHNERFDLAAKAFVSNGVFEKKFC